MKIKTLFIHMIAIAGLWTGLGNPAQAQEKNMKNETTFPQIFPQGEKLPQQFSQYFIGQAYLAPLTKNSALNVPASNVTFEPGCRNNWHSHTGGQLLICTAGRGYYQEKDQPARELLPGDVVEIAPNVIHWHGAAPDSWFSHIAIECNPQTNQNTWLEPVDDEQYAKATARTAAQPRLTEAAISNRAQWFGADSPFLRTDPDLVEIVDNFALGEVANHGELDTQSRIMVTMVCTIAQHAVSEFRQMVRAALANGITPVEVKEVIYHAVPYAGVAKVVDCLTAANEILAEQGVVLPLPSQSTTSAEDRYQKGLDLQVDIFGPQMNNRLAESPDDQKHITRFLSANCFGDYQTRTSLTAAQREMLTFSILISLGGCESQVKGHIQGNLNVGNDRDKLLAVATQLLPYNGYPRTLNAIACINEVAPAGK